MPNKVSELQTSSAVKYRSGRARRFAYWRCGTMLTVHVAELVERAIASPRPNHRIDTSSIGSTYQPSDRRINDRIDMSRAFVEQRQALEGATHGPDGTTLQHCADQRARRAWLSGVIPTTCLPLLACRSSSSSSSSSSSPRTFPGPTLHDENGGDARDERRPAYSVPYQ